MVFQIFQRCCPITDEKGLFYLIFLPPYVLQAPVLDPCTFPFPWPVDYSLVGDGFIFLWEWRGEKTGNSI